jgi:hypothetical protein
MKKIVILLFNIMAATSGFAQLTISGQVLDHNNEPVWGANILVQNAYDGASSDDNGKFEFETSEALPITIEISYIGYRSQQLQLVDQSEGENLSIRLQEDISNLENLVITAASFEAGDASKSTHLSSLDIVSTAGALGDINGAITTLPGSTVNGESGRLFVRGGDASETAVFIDGMLVQRPYGSSAPNIGVRGRYSPFLFKGTFFSSGGYSAEYGQALSSVLALKTEDVPEFPETNLSIMAVGFEAGHSQKIDRTSFHTEGSYYNLSPLFSVLPLNHDWEKEPSSGSFLLHVNHEFENTHHLGFFTSYQTNELGIYQRNEYGQKALQQVYNQNYYVNVNAKGPIGKTWNYRAGGSFTFNEDDLQVDTLNLSEKENSGFAKMVVEGEVSESISLKFGSEFQRYNWNQQANGLNRKTPVTIGAAYAEATWAVSKKFGLIVGYRHEYFEPSNVSFAMPRLSMAYQLSEASRVSFATGQYYQKLQANDYLQFRDLDFSSAQHYILSYQWENKDQMFRAELYQKSYDDLLLNTQKGANQDGYGFARGLDLWWRDRKTIKNADYWISYSFIDAQRLERNYPVSAQPAFVARHNLSVVYKHFVPSLRSQIGGTWQYNSGRPYDLPGDDRFNDQLTRPYASLNLNWAYLYRQNIIFYASVSNVTGRKNVFGYQFYENPGQDTMNSSPIVPAYDRFYFVGIFITLSSDRTKNQLDTL